MIPEEKFSNEIWWVLQEIKKERLYSPDGDKNKIDFSIRTSSHTDDNTPPAETQRKLLIKLVEWKAIELRQNLVEILDEVRNKISKMPSSDANPIIELPEPTKARARPVLTSSINLLSALSLFSRSIFSWSIGISKCSVLYPKYPIHSGQPKSS